MSDWIKWFLLGLLSIAFGVFALGNAIAASVAVTVVTGVLLLIAGALQVVGGFTVEGTGNKILSLIMGVVMLFLGWSFLDHPLQGTLTLATVMLVLFMAGGIARVILSFQMKGTQFFWPTMISGILSIVLAVIIWTYVEEEPQALLSILGIFLGIEMLFNGFGLVFMALFIKNAPKDETIEAKQA
ncbi:HdeD family acid-resistance protein [Ruegeria arenilitoris]|uniref:HdeD family acid-resistance protein n=1 Tax=Ruegeria arenilitoris TaxID=1173585 RepID=UPI00147FDB60|nr:HdeD family acid-resistance protein [Ruegeria arenilitoris]